MALFAKLARFEGLARPAAVLGVIGVVTIIGAVCGGGESAGMESEPAAQVASEATAEPHAEATAEPHAEATADPHAEATDDPGAEATADPQAEATVDLHAEVAAALQTGATVSAVATERPATTQRADFVSVEFGVAFRYEVAPDGFVLGQVRAPEAALAVVWSLARKSELAAAADDAFGPPGMTIEVFVPEPFPADAEAWVRASGRSNLARGTGELEPATVGGAQGVRYAWSGPYEAVSVVVQFDARIWVFTATYRDDIGEIESEFERLLESVVFTK